MEPKITVIIPVYNTEQYLRECLDSVCAQTLRELEIICIDDGSSDRSREILEDYRSRDSRIRVISQQNQGAGTARNRGIAEARGEFIAFLDSDDLLPDNSVYADLYNAAKAQTVNVCGGSFWVFKPGENPHPSGVPEESFPHDALLHFRDFQWDFGFTCYIFSRELILQNRFRFPPYSRYEDPPFFAKVMVCADKFFALKRPTYLYRFAHKKANWDFKKATDLLYGIRDNLKFSKTQNLAILHYNQVFRLLTEYKKIITRQFESHPDFPSILYKTSQEIDFNLINHCRPKIVPAMLENWHSRENHVPAMLIRLFAFFIFNRSVRKRWRELHLS